LGLLLACGLVGSARPAAAQAVNWRDDYKKAREEAVQTGRPLLLDFGTENCYWCKQLDQKTFRDPAVVNLLNERFIPLKIDGDRSPALAAALRVQKYPTLVIAAPGGAVLNYQEGFLEPAALAELMHNALLAVFTPEWMARDFQAATEAREKGDYARALALLRDVVEDGKDRPVQAKARQLLKELEEQAATRVARARELADGGRRSEAVDALNEVANTFPDTPAAREGRQFAFQLTSRSKSDDPQRLARARELLLRAKEDYRSECFVCCMERCEALTTEYADLPEGAEATRLLAEITGNPEWMKQACEQLGDRLGTLYLSLAESCLKKGQPQQAVTYLERLVQALPNSRHAETAQARLAQIQGQPPRPGK
jgi:thioredoxin-like negative regulator of GroEL